MTIYSSGVRFPRPCLLAGFRFCLLPTSDQGFVSQPFSGKLSEYHLEPSVIVGVLPVVKAERLFVNVAEQVIGFHTDVGAVDSAFQETPEVLHAIGMDVLTNVLNRVIFNLMLVLFAESIVGLQRVAIESRSGFHVLVNQRVQLGLAAFIYYLGAHLAATFQNGSDDSFAFRTATPLDLAGLNIGVHVARFLADESFINFDFAGEFAAGSFVLHCKPDAVEHEPSSLLGNSEVAGD